MAAFIRPDADTTHACENWRRCGEFVAVWEVAIAYERGVADEIKHLCNECMHAEFIPADMRVKYVGE